MPINKMMKIFSKGAVCAFGLMLFASLACANTSALVEAFYGKKSEAPKQVQNPEGGYVVEEAPQGRLVTNDAEVQRARVALVDGKLPPLIKDGIPRIDASSEDAFQQSFFDALMALDDDTQEKFSAGMTTIGVMLSDYGDPRLVQEVYHNKTPDEIIAISRKISPNVKDNTLIINGSNITEFGRSVGKIMVNLEPKKQAEFSEALAKFMHDSDKDNHESLLKTLDGKTADEVIKMSTSVRVPFDVMSSRNKAIRDIEIDSVSKEDAEKVAKRGIFTPKGEGDAEEEKEETPSLSESLSPSSVIPRDE